MVQRDAMVGHRWIGCLFHATHRFWCQAQLIKYVLEHWGCAQEQSDDNENNNDNRQNKAK